MQAIASILDFFDTHRRSISADGHTIVFAQPNLLAEYNRRTLAIRQVRDEQSSLEEKHAALVGNARQR